MSACCVWKKNQLPFLIHHRWFSGQRAAPSEFHKSAIFHKWGLINTPGESLVVSWGRFIEPCCFCVFNIWMLSVFRLQIITECCSIICNNTCGEWLTRRAVVRGSGVDMQTAPRVQRGCMVQRVHPLGTMNMCSKLGFHSWRCITLRDFQ